MLFIRYCNKRNQLVEQLVISELAKSKYHEIVKEFGQADLIFELDGVEYCVL